MAINVSALSSTAKMLIAFESNTIRLERFEQSTDKQKPIFPKTEELQAIIDSVVKAIPFEVEVATTRRRLKNNDDLNTIKTSFNTIQDHIIKMQKEGPIFAQRLTEATSLSSKISEYENELQTVSKKYLNACEERLKAKRAKNPQALAAIEATLVTMRGELEKTFKKGDELQAAVNDIYAKTPNAPAPISQTAVSTPRPGGRS